jgi:spore coat protein A
LPSACLGVSNVLNGAGALGGNLNFNAAKYTQQGLCADPLDAGWKDTIKMFPGEITRLALRWAPQGVPVAGVSAG